MVLVLVLVLRCWRRIWGAMVGREGEKKGGVSVEMLDGQRHDVECMDRNALEGVFSFMRGYQVIFKSRRCCSRSPVAYLREEEYLIINDNNGATHHSFSICGRIGNWGRERERKEDASAS